MSDEGQKPDTRPGPYYVSIIEGRKYALLSGPYPDHTTALALVDKAREIVLPMDPRAHFYAFGTSRMKDPNYNRAGVLQRLGWSLNLEEER
jgi:hypothetical protein